MINSTPPILEALELPVLVRAKHASSGPVQFWLPLTPIFESASLSDSLRDVVTELYLKVVLPAFKEEPIAAW